MALRRGTGVALWRQIEMTLTEEIGAGGFGDGLRLPTEAELARRFQVNRHTLRQALAALGERGLVRTEQGRGTFVNEDMLDYVIGRRTRFSEIVSAQRRTPGGRLLASREERPAPAIALALGLKRHASAIVLATLGEADGRPVSVATHYFPSSRFRGIDAAYGEAGSITRALRRFGVTDYSRRTTRITARLPEPEDAELLRQPANRPVLVAESLNVDTDGRPIEFGIARFAGDRVQIVFNT